VADVFYYSTQQRYMNGASIYDFSSENGDEVAANVLDQDGRHPWHPDVMTTSPTTYEHVEIQRSVTINEPDFLESDNAVVAAALYVRPAGSYTWAQLLARLRMQFRTSHDQSQLTSSPNYDSGAQSLPQDLMELGEKQGYVHLIHVDKAAGWDDADDEWARFDFNATGGSLEVKIGALWWGSAWSPSYTPDFGFEIGYDEEEVKRETLGGSESRQDRKKRKLMSAAFSQLSTADAVAVAIHGLDIGASARALAVIVPDSNDNSEAHLFSAHGFLQSPRRRPRLARSRVSDRRWEWGFAIEERF